MSVSSHPLFPDPRVYPAATGSSPYASWYALARATLESSAPAPPEAVELRRAVGSALRDAPAAVDNAVEHAPTAAIARQLWRTADDAWANDAAAADEGIALVPFAVPLVILAGVTTGQRELQVPGLLTNGERVAAVLRNGKALGGSAALRMAALPAWQELRAARQQRADGPRGILHEPVAMRTAPGAERVHLRFLVGTALTAAGRDVLQRTSTAGWGGELTRELTSQLAVPDGAVLVLPRAPARPLPALHDGLAAQREVSAQVFAANAVRKLRASTGEPTAVISAHRAPGAPGGGELRLSLSSPFEPRDAEGFRCPIYPIEQVGAPLSMLLELLADCRVQDVRLLGGIHPDETTGTRMPLFFKAETIPEGALIQ